ncbi:MAG: YeeE/YedE family protein [Betaproteobacteria bacterium]|nr:YeeE/YedE family protein [Betaproteobacteria bacterium]MBL8532282.1 YeeE/YedE family protein [Betaproteobacteria bacterium]
MRAATGFIAGVVFGAGLLVSQMTNPAKVRAFLDVTGAWDPSLALVMAGAVAVFGIAYRLSRRETARPVFGERFHVPDSQVVDARLIAGSLLFGAGWGLSGFCPGPAVVSAGFGDARVWVFLASTVAGVLLFRRWRAPSSS